jgi:hypothetical protein
VITRHKIKGSHGVQRRHASEPLWRRYHRPGPDVADMAVASALVWAMSIWRPWECYWPPGAFRCAEHQTPGGEALTQANIGNVLATVI